MRDLFIEILNHTHALGFITEVLVTGNDKKTMVETMDQDNTVIIKGTFKTPIKEFKGDFGIGKLDKLLGLVNFANFKADDATVEIKNMNKGGKNTPVEVVFSDAQGQSFTHRFMSPDNVSEQYEFVGADWNVVFTPSKSKLGEIRQIASVYATDNENFKVNTVDGELRFNFGDVDGGFLKVETDKKVNLKNELTWPTGKVLTVLKLDEGNAEMSILDDSRAGALQIKVSTKLADWLYIFPVVKV